MGNGDQVMQRSGLLELEKEVKGEGEISRSSISSISSESSESRKLSWLGRIFRRRESRQEFSSGWSWGWLGVVRKAVMVMLMVMGGLGFLMVGGLLIYKNYFLPPTWLIPGEKLPAVGGQVAGWESQRERSDFVVMGFLPYWMVKHEGEIRYPVLSHLAYFGLEFDEGGDLKMYEDDGTAEMGHYRMEGETMSQVIRKTRESGGEPVLVIRAMKNDLIERLLATGNSREELASKIIEQKKRKHLVGVNIDFEYVGTPPASVRRNFLEFIKALKLVMDEGSLSVDVYADAVRKVRLWDVSELAKQVDFVVVMAYDFHRAGSGLAGPVAPLRGGCGVMDLGTKDCRWDYDVTSAVADFIEVIPREKLILGVPYYGYEWQTTSTELDSPVVPQTGALATYKRVKERLGELQEVSGEEVIWEVVFDNQAMSPTLFYQDNGVYQRIWYEDRSSLRLKYELVKEVGLGGVAIWALGYDGESGDLWGLLEEEF